MRFSVCAARQESLTGEIQKSSVFLDANESPTAFHGGDASAAGTAERVNDEIAGLAGAEHDRSDESQWELGGEVGKSFAAVFNETRDAPHVVPQLAMRVGS